VSPEVILPVENCVTYVAHGLNLVSLHVTIKGGPELVVGTADWTRIHVPPSLVEHVHNTTAMFGRWRGLAPRYHICKEQRTCRSLTA